MHWVVVEIQSQVNPNAPFDVPEGRLNNLNMTRPNCVLGFPKSLFKKIIESLQLYDIKISARGETVVCGIMLKHM